MSVIQDQKIEYQGEQYVAVLPCVDKDTIQSEIAETGRFYDVDGLNRLSEIIDNDCVVVDVGSHIGNHSLFFLKVCHASHVFAYEPQEQYSNSFSQTMKLNAIDDSAITLKTTACVQMRTPLIVSQRRPENLAATKYAISDEGKVAAVILERDLKDQKIDLIKVSANEMNFLVILGAENIIKSQKPIIYTQLADFEVAAARAYLRGHGYSVSWQNNNRYIFQYEPELLVNSRFDKAGLNRNVCLYWHEHDAPKHIQERTDTWRRLCPEFNVTLFSDESAQDYIDEHYDSQWLDLYKDCAIAAMKSDVFRVLWGLKTGGIYSDLTFLPGEDIYFMSGEHSLTALLHPRKGIIRNGVFFAQAGSPALKAISDQIKYNLKNKVSNSIFMVSGPHVWNAVLAQVEPDSYCVLKQKEVFEKHFHNDSFPQTTRGGPNHWSNLQKNQSIFYSGYK